MNTTLQIRIDSKIKKDVQKLYKNLGLDISSATKMFYSQSLIRQGIPFQPLTSNGYTIEAEKRILKQSMEVKRKGKTFHNVEDLFKYLNN